MQPYPAKATIHSVRFAPWGSGGIGGGASILMASGDSTLVLGLDVMHGAVEKMADIQGLVDPGQKKVPKIYHMISHPTRWVMRECCRGRLCNKEKGNILGGKKRRN